MNRLKDLPRTNERSSGAADNPAVQGAWPRRGKWIVPVGLFGCYVGFAVAVHFRLLDSLDLAVRRTARPGNMWGPRQIRAARVVDALQPTRFLYLLALLVGTLSLFRRSLRPLLAAAAVGLPVIIVTAATKFLMEHSDPSIFPVGHGGFPSGHTITVIVVFGVAVLLFRPHTRWGWTIPAATGAVTASALILADIHPATDVVGAGLLAATALNGAATVGLGAWASAQRRM